MGQAQAHKLCAEIARCKKKEKVTISTRSSSYILARNEENYWNFLHSVLLQIGDHHRSASTHPSLDLRLFPRFSASSMYLLSYTRRLSIAPSKALQRPRFLIYFFGSSSVVPPPHHPHPSLHSTNQIQSNIQQKRSKYTHTHPKSRHMWLTSYS